MKFLEIPLSRERCGKEFCERLDETEVTIESHIKKGGL